MDFRDQDDLERYVANDDEKAFEALVDRHLPSVFGAAWRRTRDRELAEEICQNVFIVLAQKAEQGLVVQRSLSAWLYRVTLNQAAHVLRTERVRKKKMKTYEELAEIERETSRETLTLEHLLDEVLVSLREIDREVLLLHYGEGRTFAEIASVVGRSEGACQKVHRRALSRARQRFARRGLALPTLTIGLGLTTALSKSHADIPISAVQVAGNAMQAVSGGGAMPLAVVGGMGAGSAIAKSWFLGGLGMSVAAAWLWIQGVPPAEAREWQRLWEMPAIAGAAVGQDGTVYFAGEKTFYAVDPLQKRVRWTHGQAVELPGKGVHFWPGDPVVGPDGAVVVWLTERLVALEPKDGSLRWEHFPRSFLRPTGLAVDQSGNVYVGLYDGPGEVFLSRLEASSGEVRWRQAVGVGELGLQAPVVAANGMVCFLDVQNSGAGIVRAFDSGTGERLWESEPLAKVSGQLVLGDDGNLYAGAHAIDWATGNLLWRAEIPSELAQLVWSPNGTLFVSRGSWVSAIDVANGQVDWRTFLGASNVYELGGSTALAGDDTLYVQTRKGIQVIDAGNGRVREVIPYGALLDQNHVGEMTVTEDGFLYAQSHDRLVALRLAKGRGKGGWTTDGGGADRAGSRDARGAPVLVAQSEDSALLDGAFGRLQVLASGTRPLRYQWFFEGEAIPGATNAWLDIGTFSPSQVGDYTVRVSNVSGSSESKGIRVALGHPLHVSIQGTGDLTISPKRAAYLPGSEVEIRATPETAGRLQMWSGDVSSRENAVRVTMDGPKRVEAHFDPGPGNLKWRYRMKSESTASMMVQVGHDGTVYASETVREGIPLTRIVALDAGSGAMRWEAGPFNGLHTVGIGARGEVLAPSGHSLSVIDSQDGMILEQYPKKGASSLARSIPATTFNGSVVLVDDTIKLLDSKHLQVQWMVDVRGTDPPPAIGLDGTIYVGGRELTALDGETGDILWTLGPEEGSTGYGYAAPAMDLQGSVYCFTNRLVQAGGENLNETGVVAVDGPSGEVRWRRTSEVRINWLRDLPAVSREGVVYFREGERLLALNGGSGELEWARALSGGFSEVAIDGDGHVVVGLSSGKIEVLDGGTGESLWWMRTDDGQPVVAVAIGPDGTLYGLTMSTLYAIEGWTGERPQWPSAMGGAIFRRPYDETLVK